MKRMLVITVLIWTAWWGFLIWAGYHVIVWLGHVLAANGVRGV